MTAHTPNIAELQRALALIREALQEDLQGQEDITSNHLIPESAEGQVRIVSRKAGTLSGLPFASMVFEILGQDVSFRPHLDDGASLSPGTCLATLQGPVRALLLGERTALNFLTMLSGTASLTRQYVEAIAGTHAEILDTRKTFPGLRLLQKYAVRCGGGTNHRLGLYDAVLIKDNHLGAWKAGGHGTLAEAIRHVRQQVAQDISITIEVDTLDQFQDALQGAPDIVLLDNMNLQMLREAVSLRQRLAPATQLEASGGVNLQTVGEIARTGVDRISVGALTHSAPALDLGFDWG